MIARHRTPSGENRDRDFGPGPVGNLRGNYERAQSALPLTEAIAPKIEGWSDKDRARKAREYRQRQAA